MGIKYLEVDEISVFQLIHNVKSSLILKRIDSDLITPEVCLAAVRANGLAIKHVPHKLLSQEIAVEAIRNNRNAFYFLPFLLTTNYFKFASACFNAFVGHYKDKQFLRKLFK